MESDMNKSELGSTIKYAGAFIAWVIGSGFATGQEILQFFTSYGPYSFAVILVNLVGFMLLGVIMFTKGYDHRDQEHFDHYKYYCGEKLGSVFSWIIPTILFFVMAVLISAAGATVKEYYGFNKYIGSAIMAVFVLIAYLNGFEKIVNVVSKIGPVIIAFSIFVGAFTVVRDWQDISDIDYYSHLLEGAQPSGHWLMSAILYISLTFIGGNIYYSAVGHSAVSRSSGKWGAIIGTIFLMISIGLMSTAILVNADETAGMDVPTLFLANKISSVFGHVFSVTLILGIFSTCSTMMWSFNSRFDIADKRKNVMFALMVSVSTYLLSLFPFGGLISVLYPAIGYVGIIFIICVAYKGLTDRG